MADAEISAVVKIEPYTYHGRYIEIGCLVKDVLALGEEEWGKFTNRQRYVVAQKHTETIPLLYDPAKPSKAKRQPLYGLFEQHLDTIAGVLGVSIERASLVRLAARSEIAPHYDVGKFLNSTRRIHVPVVSNPGCWFVVDGQRKHLPVGEMWEINNTGMEHSVHNDGDAARIHLILDIR